MVGCINKPMYVTVAKERLKDFGTDKISLTSENAYLKNYVFVLFNELLFSSTFILLIICCCYFLLYALCATILHICRCSSKKTKLFLFNGWLLCA